jgi:ABC-type multidrug transport system ATPase subunit
MRLFAIVSQVHSVEEIDIARRIVNDYLNLIVRKDSIRQYLIMYDFYHNSMREREIKKGDKQLSLFSVKAMIICENANEFLDKKQKILVFTYILEILSATKHSKPDDIDFVKTIAISFKIDDILFRDCLSFVFNRYNEIHSKKNILIISSQNLDDEVRYMYKEFIVGKIVFLYINSVNICLFKHVDKDDQLYFNDQEIELENTYILEKGGVIKSPLLGAVYYNDIIKIFLQDDNPERVLYVAEDVAYKYPNSDTGIEPFNFCEESGQLIGIMGGSGVGKSTLLNILNGNISPTKGQVLINGYNITTERDSIEGLVGYVPQDDLLIEELTVFQNLYFNASLCFRSYSKEKIIDKVNRLLHSLDLFNAKDLLVGSTLNNLISGGQRKRLNIALELIREPYVLFADEPTSGLSSNDSEKVIDLLKHQSLKGKLVVVNIHQPSSDIFKQFDKLILLDTGGHIVFQGNPQDSIIYLKSYNQLVDAEEGECPSCGNLNPEQTLQILEMRKVNEFGVYTRQRLVDAKEWYQNYIKEQKKEVNLASKLKTTLPTIEFHVPSKFNQFKIFNIRNILTKLSDKQFLLINLLEAPVLAFILGWFTKYNAGNTIDKNAYVFSENINIPVYIFMGVVVSIFLGLMLSAEDIIRDRRLLKREAFLHLNRVSYYNAKVFFICITLCVQALLFVLIGNTILEIKGMYFHYWLMFSVSAIVAGLLGLNISATLRTVVSIYILIPILIVPQLLLGGALIPFDKLNKKVTNTEYVPVVGDIMPSRWAYEALMVYQFTNNDYQKLLYEFEKNESSASYGLNYYMPELQNVLMEIRKVASEPKHQVSIEANIGLLNTEIQKLKLIMPHCFKGITSLDPKAFNVAAFSELENSLQCARDYYIKALSAAIDQKDNRFFELERKLGSREKLLQMRTDFSNEQLANMVSNKNDRQKIDVVNNKIIRRVEPIYCLPEMKLGRACLFSPAKRIGNYYIDTYWFNLLILSLLGVVF